MEPGVAAQGIAEQVDLAAYAPVERREHRGCST